MSSLVHTMNAEQCQTTTDLWSKLTDLSLWPAWRQLWNYIHHHHLLFICCSQPQII